MSEDRLTIATATGVDVSLAIAGPGSRSYAFIIDWHVRLLLALAWYLVAALVVAGSVAPEGAGSTQPAFVLGAVFPSLAIYFLYHPLLEVLMRGRTPGKRMAGVRIASRSGAVPSTGALLIRNVFRIVDSMPVLYLVGLVTTFFTAEHVRIGDLAAGTVLVWEQQDPSAALKRFAELSQAPSLDPAALDVVNDLLARWEFLDRERRAGLARALLSRLEPATAIVPLELLPDAALRERLQALFQAERAPG